MKKNTIKPITVKVERKSTRNPKALNLPADRKEQEEFKIMRLTDDKNLTSKLVTSSITSFRQLAAMPGEALLQRFDGKLSNAEEKSIYVAQRKAQSTAVYAADRATEAKLEQSPNATWPARPGDNLPDHILCHCGCCDSIFSLKAYLFDLLDLLQHYWDIDVGVVETLLQRSFSELHVSDPGTRVVVHRDLNCDELNAPLPQSRIAAEVLETYLVTLGIALPSNDANWQEKFVDRLLRLIAPQEIQIPILAGSSAARLTITNVEAQFNLLTTNQSGDDERIRSRRLTVKQRLQPFVDALAAWKAELATLELNLAGIDKAVSLLSDYTQNFTGFNPNTLLSVLPADASDDQKRVVEITQKFEQAREATMRQWLVDYRDALREATKKSVEILEASLFISLNSGSCRTTTRLQELVTSVQQIVENIRSGEIVTADRLGLSGEIRTKLLKAVKLPMAESSWQRLRDYETWLGYMYGWVYPENVLSPLVDEIDNESFKSVLDRLQAEPLTAESVRAIYVEAVTSLKEV